MVRGGGGVSELHLDYKKWGPQNCSSLHFSRQRGIGRGEGGTNRTATTNKVNFISTSTLYLHSNTTHTATIASSSKLVVGKDSLFPFSNTTVGASINTTSPSYRYKYHFQYVNTSFYPMTRGTQPIRTLTSRLLSAVSRGLYRTVFTGPAIINRSYVLWARDKIVMYCAISTHD